MGPSCHHVAAEASRFIPSKHASHLSTLRTLSEDQGERPTRERLRQLLSASQAPTSVWPDDARFLGELTASPLYKRASGRLALLVLEALEQALRTAKQESVTINGYLSVEHVWPQNPAAGAWPATPGWRTDGTFDVAAYDAHERLIHCLGNLTLVTPYLNSSLSNGPFPAKRIAIAQQSLLRLNAYFQTIPDEPGWGVQRIQARAATLVEIALTIWPRPA